MRKTMLIIVIGALGLYGYQRARQPALAQSIQSTSAQTEFRCDGRTHCSQMTSCEEATFFLQNCPGVKMDGEGDGVPCERQWCGHR